MDNAQVKTVLQIINGNWAHHPLEGPVAAVWGAELAKHDFEAVFVVVREFMCSRKWRPTLGELIAPLLGGQGKKSAAEAFAAIWEQASKRPQVVSPMETEAVRRLGGWSTIGRWEEGDRHFHYGRFEQIWSELDDEEQSIELRAKLGASRTPALSEGS